MSRSPISPWRTACSWAFFSLTAYWAAAWAPLALAQDPAQPSAPQSSAAPAPAAIYPGFSGYERPVTTRVSEAQQWFNQGIQLLYGFNHDEAIRSFERAAALDPSCAMAWWGSAYARGLHINNPQMGEQQSRAAYEAAERAVAALDDETEVERALVEAVATRYAWPVPENRDPLDQQYAEAMERVWHRFADDPDVGALYAESLMNLQPWDLWTGDAKPKGRVLEILAVLERTLAKAPQHPGANHFYIHAIEASPWPEKGTAAAERLQELVPGSGHLVHMPSHIFIRTGRYRDAEEANARAIAADERYFAKAPAPDFYSLYFLHNVHFLAYAAMMEGRYETALEAARKIEQEIPEKFLRDYVVIADGFMPTALHVMIRFGKWEEILAEPEPPAWRRLSRAERHFARSLAASALGKAAQAREELAALDRVAAELNEAWNVGNNAASDVLAVARTMAAGELAFREGQPEQAFALLRQAVALEEQLTYDEPPGWMQPVRHALGALLMADRRFAEAEEVYRADLVRHPNNAWSLLGLQQSLEAQIAAEPLDGTGEVLRKEKESELEALIPEVERAWARADVVPVASCYCHPDALSGKAN